MKCPRDGTSLNLSLQSEQAITRCNKCTGTVIQLAHMPDLKKGSPHLTNSINSSMRCPKCSKPMLAIIYQDIEIDLCLDCELVWLDKGEREKILQQQKNQDDRWYKNLDAPAPDITINKPTSSSNSLADAAGDLDVLSFVGDAISGLFDAF